MSFVEIGQLIQNNKLSFNLTNPANLAWHLEIIRLTGIVPLPIDLEIGVLAYNLPGEFHKDPADRIISATALHHGATLLTSDEKILAYASQGHLKAVRV